MNDWLISYSIFIYNALSIRGVYVFDDGKWEVGNGKWKRGQSVGSGQEEKL